MLQWKDLFFKGERGREREKKIQSLHQKSKNIDERGLAKCWYLLSWIEIQVVPYIVLFTFRFEHFQKKKQCLPPHNTHTHAHTFQWLLGAHILTTKLLTWPLRSLIPRPVLVFPTSAPTSGPLHVLFPLPDSQFLHSCRDPSCHSGPNTKSPLQRCPPWRPNLNQPTTTPPFVTSISPPS